MDMDSRTTGPDWPSQQADREMPGLRTGRQHVATLFEDPNDLAPHLGELNTSCILSRDDNDVKASRGARAKRPEELARPAPDTVSHDGAFIKLRGYHDPDTARRQLTSTHNDDKVAGIKLLSTRL